jgi:DNA-binding transcriptional LysR family regulator
LEDSRLLSRKLGPHRLCAFASPAYLKDRGIPRHPNDLVAHDIVNLRYQSNGQTFRWPFRIGDKTVEIVPEANITVDSSDVLVSMLVAGGGIGIAATFATVRQVARGELVPVLEQFAVDRHNITIIWPESRRANPAVRAFIDWLQIVFRERVAAAEHLDGPDMQDL